MPFLRSRRTVFQRQRLMDRISAASRDKGRRGISARPNQPGGFGFIGGGTTTTGSTAAFNERVRHRALYGKYGKGGLVREGGFGLIGGGYMGGPTGGGQDGARSSAVVSQRNKKRRMLRPRTLHELESMMKVPIPAAWEEAMRRLKVPPIAPWDE